MSEGPNISIVVPCYNEEENIEALYKALKSVLADDHIYELIFVDDGSQDQSLDAIKRLRSNDKNVKYLSFSRNFGHQAAIKAGIDHASGDCIITMDADLQHPPDLLPELIRKWKEGYQVVYTKRRHNRRYGLLKRTWTKLFYKTITWLSDIKIEEGMADFRLIDRQVADLIRSVSDNFLFLRGLLPWYGFPSTVVSFDVHRRHAGKTKYTFRKMMSLAIAGITAFSIRPLRLSVSMGLIISAGAFLYALYAIYAKLFLGDVVEGWTSVLVAVLFIGGIQLVMMGIIGEYLGKLFLQSKGRPSYIIRDCVL